MKTNLAVFAVAVLWLCAAGPAAAQTPDPADRSALIEAVKPKPSELKWQRIPWLTDLAEGQRVAVREKRPIFLWVTGDDPLGRC